MRKQSIDRAAVLLLSLLASGASAAPCELVRGTRLASAPDPAAASGMQIPAAAPLDCLEQAQGWQKVRTVSGQIGWVRRYQVRVLTTAIANEAQGGFRQQLTRLARLVTGLFGDTDPAQRSGSTVTATIGIRGLSEDAATRLAATADPMQLERLERIATTPEQATDFARDGGLRQREIESRP